MVRFPVDVTEATFYKEGVESTSLYSTLAEAVFWRTGDKNIDRDREREEKKE